MGILALIKREFRLFLTNKTLLSVFFLAPIAYALLIGFTYKEGKVTEIPVLLVNADKTPTAQQVVDMLEDNSSLRLIHYSQIPKEVSAEVIRQNAAAVVIIPERFEAMMLQKKYPEINVYINTSNVLTGNFASKAIQITLGTFSAGAEIKALQRRGMSSEQAKSQMEPFKMNYITLYNTTSNYLVFMWPPLMAVVLQQVILLAMAVSFSEDFKRASFITDFKEKQRYTALIMAIKSLPVWIFSIFNLLVFYVFSLFFKLPTPEDPLHFFGVTAVFVLAACNLGVFVSILVPDPLKATQVLMVIASPAFIVSGFTWPVYSMPTALRYLTNIIPLTPYLEALKILLIQKGESSLTNGFYLQLVAQSLIYFVLGWVALKFKIKSLFKVDKTHLETS